MRNDPGLEYVTAKGSPNTVAASWNETRCFRRFCLALAGSHSKFTTLSYPAAARRSNHSPSTPSSRAGGRHAIREDAPSFYCLSRAPALPYPSPDLSSLPACPNLVFALNIQTFQCATFKRFVIYDFQIVLDRDHNH